MSHETCEIATSRVRGVICSSRAARTSAAGRSRMSAIRSVAPGDEPAEQAGVLRVFGRDHLVAHGPILDPDGDVARFGRRGRERRPCNPCRRR